MIEKLQLKGGICELELGYTNVRRNDAFHEGGLENDDREL